MMMENTKDITKQFEFDILVIGGGPAGCAAALTLLNQTSLRIGIVESTDYSNMRIGESVSSSIMPLLQYLGIEPIFLSDHHLSATRIDASWGAKRIFSREFFFTAQGTGWNLDRRLFDKMLMDKVIKKNATVFLSTVIFSANKDEKWNLVALSQNKKIKITTNFIIDATGKKSSFLRSLSAEWKVYDYLIGIGGILEGAYAQNESSATLLETTAHGWWYLTPICGNKMVVVFMTDGDIANENNLKDLIPWQDYVKQTLHISKRIKSTQISEINLFPAYSQLLTKLPDLNVIPVGDAASSFDPLSSIGIGHAISSGIHGAQIIYEKLNSGDDGHLDKYLQNLQLNFSEYLLNKKYYYGVEKRWKENLFWKRRQTTM